MAEDKYLDLRKFYSEELEEEVKKNPLTKEGLEKKLSKYNIITESIEISVFSYGSINLSKDSKKYIIGIARGAFNEKHPGKHLKILAHELTHIYYDCSAGYDNEDEDGYEKVEKIIEREAIKALEKFPEFFKDFLDKSNLYNRLEFTKKVEDRRKMIRNYLKLEDLTNILPEDSQLSLATSIPSNKNLPCFSLPFVVGKKYRKKYTPLEAYLLGIVNASNKTELLFAFKGEDSIKASIRSLPIYEVVSPEKDGLFESF